MITLRSAADRGHANLGWLDSRHTFSFGTYHDPLHMGFGPLRVINEDRVQPGQGFGAHPHRDMEIISYVLEGALEHKDSLGTGSVIRPGDVQRMSAGTGIQHSEFNHSLLEPVHFLQIWLIPESRDLKPGYEQKRFEKSAKRGRLRLIASRDGREGSVTVHLDASVYASVLDNTTRISYVPQPRRRLWMQVARGSLSLNRKELSAGDGAAIEDERELDIASRADGTEFLLFDMA